MYSVGSDEIFTKTDYAHLDSPGIGYCVSFPSKVRTCGDEECATVLTETEFYYDDLSLGEISLGDQTSEKKLIRYSEDTDHWAVINRSYDTYGNLKSEKNAEEAVTEYSYWEPSYIFLKSIQIDVKKGKAEDQAVRFTKKYWWDQRYGVLTDVIDPNGRWKNYIYDGFGRIKKVRSSDPQETFNQPGNDEQLLLLESFAYGDFMIPYVVTKDRYSTNEQVCDGDGTCYSSERKAGMGPRR